jgi:hypothetical protein
MTGKTRWIRLPPLSTFVLSTSPTLIIHLAHCQLWSLNDISLSYTGFCGFVNFFKGLTQNYVTKFKKLRHINLNMIFNWQKIYEYLAEVFLENMWHVTEFMTHKNLSKRQFHYIFKNLLRVNIFMTSRLNQPY